MKSRLSVVVCASLLTTGFASYTEAALLETLSVPTDGNSVNSSTVLLAGTDYIVSVSGTFQVGGPGDGLADAEYADFSDPPNSLLDFTGSGIDLGVSIDGNNTDWGAYASDHVYSILLSGNNSTIAIRYLDENYLDNTGNLTLTISSSPVPVPPAAWLFGSGLLGLVGMARCKKTA